MQQMRYVDSYALNKNVISLFVNVSSDMSSVYSSVVIKNDTIYSDKTPE